MCIKTRKLVKTIHSRKTFWMERCYFIQKFTTIVNNKNDCSNLFFCLFQYTTPITSINPTNILTTKDNNATSLLSKVQRIFGKLSLQNSDREQIDESWGIEAYTAIVICVTLSILLMIIFFCYYFSCIRRCSMIRKSI